jgi:hypothetical protein
MKINMVEDAKHLNGYENVGFANLEDLNKVCEDGEAIELIADDILGKIPGPSVQVYLSQWLKKIRLGGKIILTGLDIYDSIRSFNSNLINITDLNVLLYGENRRSVLGANDIVTALKLSGFKIIKNNLINLKYLIVAERIS